MELKIVWGPSIYLLKIVLESKENFKHFKIRIFLVALEGVGGWCYSFNVILLLDGMSFFVLNLSLCLILVVEDERYVIIVEH